MSMLITILRAAHCRSTHHFFAIDALEYVKTEEGGRLASLLLAKNERYLLGAKDPDKKFRDFQNHVLHVGDNYWGGACRAAEKWFDASIDALDGRRWGEAAYCIGVLSHYFTDPLMPLHTGSSDAEGVVHRPMEWSVCKAYEQILTQWENSGSKAVFQTPESANWIRDAVTRAAELSHPHYDRIIKIYDFARGVKNPPAGLNSESRTILAEMFGYAITGLASIIDRIAYACNVDIPSFSTTIPTLMAGINMPSAWIVKKFESDDERRAVAAILDEYNRTGTVKQNLPAEVRSVKSNAPLRKRRTLERETVSKRQPEPQPQRIPVVSHPPTTPSPIDTPTIETPEPNVLESPASAPEQPRTEKPRTEEPKPELLATPLQSVSRPTEHEPDRRAEKRSEPPSDRRGETSSPKPRVSEASDLVDAPSIGPKTAKRFAKIGIQTIGQFLAADPVDMAERLETRWINEELLVDWQDQARLVCQLGSLCGYKAQLLVGVECRAVDQLAVEEAGDLAAEIADFAVTKAGERILRSGSPPDVAEVQKWIDEARGKQSRAA
ncbi:MAG: DUF4332 domain-containing protein [Planctomycetota bacterium]